MVLPERWPVIRIANASHSTLDCAMALGIRLPVAGIEVACPGRPGEATQLAAAHLAIATAGESRNKAAAIVKLALWGWRRSNALRGRPTSMKLVGGSRCLLATRPDATRLVLPAPDLVLPTRAMRHPRSAEAAPVPQGRMEALLTGGRTAMLSSRKGSHVAGPETRSSRTTRSTSAWPLRRPVHQASTASPRSPIG